MVKIKDRLMGIIPYGLLLIINYYGLPLLIGDTGTAMLVLLVLVPLTSFGCSMVYGVKQGFHFLYVGIATLLFVPSIFIFYNSTAWVYVLFYGVVALAGNSIGHMIYRKRNKQQ